MVVVVVIVMVMVMVVVMVMVMVMVVVALVLVVMVVVVVGWLESTALEAYFCEAAGYHYSTSSCWQQRHAPPLISRFCSLVDITERS